MTLQSITVEIELDGVWTDITSFVHDTDAIEIKYGQADEGGEPEPATCNLRLNNRDGRFSVFNPESPYYPHLKRNTSLRVLVGADPSFYGELANLTLDWNPLNTDVWVPVEAAGMLRRLGQGRKRVESILRRRILGLTGSQAPLAYWTLEDEAERVTRYSSAIQYVEGMKAFNPLPSPASFSDFPCSLPIPTINPGGMIGYVPGASLLGIPVPGGQTQLRFLVHLPSGGISVDGDTRIITLWTTGSAHEWIIYEPSATPNRIGIQIRNAVGSLLLDQTFARDTEDRLLYMSLGLRVSGSNVNFRLWQLNVESGALKSTATLSVSGSAARATQVMVGRGSNDLEGASIGHISVQGTSGTSSRPGAFSNDELEAIRGFPGEPAAERIERLCDEEGLICRIIGSPEDTAKMGPQFPGTFLELARECAVTDMGLLNDDREQLGLVYRTRKSLYTQDDPITLDYEADHLSQTPQPVPDDQRTRNDISVSRERGSEFRVVKQTGPLSVSDIGRYAEAFTVSLQNDDQLQDQASWRLHLGTYDDPRLTSIATNVAAQDIIDNDPDLITAINTVDLGDRVDIVNIRSADRVWASPEDSRQIILGYTETLRDFEHEIVFNCMPYQPWQVGVRGNITGGIDQYEDNPPMIGAVATTTNNAATTHNVDIPAGAVDDLILVMVNFGLPISVNDITFTGFGFVTSFVSQLSGSPHTVKVWKRIATSASAVTEQLITDQSVSTQVIVARIDAGTFTDAIDDESTSSYSTGVDPDASPNPTGVSMSLGSLRYLRMVLAGWMQNDATPTIDGTADNNGYPPNFTLNQTTEAPTAVDRPGIALASHQTSPEADFFDPGPFTLTGDASWISFSVAVAPAIDTTPIDVTAGTRRDSDATTLASAVSDSATSIDIAVADGILWTTEATDLPYDLMIGGERVRVTAFGTPAAGDQRMIVTRSINGITKAHDAGTKVKLFRDEKTLRGL